MENSLLNYSFYRVCEIELARNIDGSIKEFYPEKNYEKEIELNKYGDGPFCRFSIPVKWSGAMGVYVLFLDNELKYIGQCVDLAKRYNQGYGQIQPRNCFVNGQSTNCKINKVILDAVKNNLKVELYFHETNLYDEIETKLIDFYKPTFNSQRGKIVLKESANRKAILLDKKTDEKVRGSAKPLGVKDVYKYLEELLIDAKGKDLKYFEIISGNIHRELGLVQRMPTVCDAMYKLKKENDIIVYSPEKGRGSKLHIRYFL